MHFSSFSHFSRVYILAKGLIIIVLLTCFKTMKQLTNCCKCLQDFQYLNILLNFFRV